MSKMGVIVIAVVTWSLGAAAYAVIYVKSQLALEPPDEYARTWGFQLMMFALFRLPFLLAMLGGMLLLIALCFKPKLR